jgi:uncharacterized damage-inducible protein DinB
MSQTVRTVVELPEGFASSRAAFLFWGMEQQRRRLIEQVRDLTSDELGWQHAPGMNSIGMLLAHIAFAEAHLVQVGLLAEAKGHAEDVVGITEEDEGLPLPEDGAPSPALAGRPIEFFLDMLARARAQSRDVARRLSDEDLASLVTRPPREDGTIREFDRQWVLFHILEHEAGHIAQVNLMRHLYRKRRP